MLAFITSSQGTGIKNIWIIILIPFIINYLILGIAINAYMIAHSYVHH